MSEIKYNVKGPKEKIYDYTMETYETVFKPIIEDKHGVYNILAIKKLLAGFYAYTQAIGKNSPVDILKAIKIDYGI